MTRKWVCCACSIWVIYGFKRAKIQYFQPKVAHFAIFPLKNGAFKHASDWTHSEASNALFRLQNSYPRSFSNVACVKTVNAPFFDVRNMCKIETSESKSGWATRLPIFSACIAFFCFYAPYDHDSVCVRKSWCYRSIQICSTSFLKLWKLFWSRMNWHSHH